MTKVLPIVLLMIAAALVFSAGWRMLSPHNSLAGGIVAALIFLIHPAVFPGFRYASPWDVLFVMLFLNTWLWLDNWSTFMRSWVLAGICAFGLWVGSPFVLWGIVAMVPWVLFNRRPLAAVGSLATVLVGGLLIFGVTWAAAFFLVPNVSQPLFRQWIRWSGLALPPPMSLPWVLLAASAVFERLREMVRDRRSDATTFAAALLLVTAFLASWTSGVVLVAISAPLIARMITKKEFLFHRRVRWVASLTCLFALALAFLFKGGGWTVTAMAMAVVWIGSWVLSLRSDLPRFMTFEAVCTGAYLAESLGSLMHLFPRY